MQFTTSFTFTYLCLCLTNLAAVHGFLIIPTNLRHGTIAKNDVIHIRIKPNSFISHKLHAKKRRKENNQDNLFDWYDKIDDDKYDSAKPTPDDIFWEEMERQKMSSQAAAVAENGNNSNKNGDSYSSSSSLGNGNVEAVLNSNAGNKNSSSQRNQMNGSPMSPMSGDAILAQFKDNMVSNNWFVSGDEKAEMDVDDLLEEQQRQIDEAWNSLYGVNTLDESNKNGDNEEEEDVTIESLSLDYDNEDDEDSDDIDAKQAEEELLQRLSNISMQSFSFNALKANEWALTKLRNRDPDHTEGMEKLWIGAVDAPSQHNLKGSLRLYGMELADNFGDWTYGKQSDQFQTIEDIASFKAREVFKVTGLPVISSQSEWEVEPSKPKRIGPISNSPMLSPRGLSGYRFNDVDDRVDQVVSALLEGSGDYSRKTKFRSCVCFYDGNMEMYTFGEVEVDLLWTKSLKCFIPLSSAITDMVNLLTTTFELEYQRWLKSKAKEAFIGYRGASIKLRDRVLRDGRVLPNGIIDVSKFMDSMVDVDLMSECGIELAQLFLDTKPTKILTVATTGLILAIPMAKELQVPVVYARKERSIVMADTFNAAYSSNTVGSNKRLYVAKNHLSSNDRVLVVDDFLSAGSSQEALMRIISDAGALPVGVGVLLEKVYDSGRKSLSGFNVPVHSMVRVASVRDRVITLVEEDGFNEDEIINI